jgi:hypothetical protein
MDVDWYSLPIYDVHFDDNYVDDYIIHNDSIGSDDIIDGIFVDKIKAECKENIESA